MSISIHIDHPLWPEFQKWTSNKVGSQAMIALWWECFLAGAAAEHRLQKKKRDKREAVEKMDIECLYYHEIGGEG